MLIHSLFINDEEATSRGIYLEVEIDDFIKKILDGKRKFERIKLKAGSNLRGNNLYFQMEEYLKNQDLKNNPIVLTDSRFWTLRAEKLYFPFVEGSGLFCFEADLRGANLAEGYFRDSNFTLSDFKGAYLKNINFEEACLKHAILSFSNLEGANLKNANLEGAYLYKTCLVRANLEGACLKGASLSFANLSQANIKSVNFEGAHLSRVENIDRAINLETAHFLDTKVNSIEKDIIDSVLKKRRWFIDVQEAAGSGGGYSEIMSSGD